MANTTRLPKLQALQDADQPMQQVHALKTLRNELAGHSARKEEYIVDGLVSVLADILQKETDEKVVVHAVRIVTILAREGPASVQPILCSDVLDAMLTHLSPPRPSFLVLAILRCLMEIADNLPPANLSEWTTDKRLATALYSSPSIGYFATIIEEAGTSTLSQQLADFVLALLCKTCDTERQKRVLVRAGCFSALVVRFASFVVQEGFVMPELSFAVDDDLGHLLNAATRSAHVSPTLELLGIMIEGSKDRAQRFLLHPVFNNILPALNDAFSPSETRKAPWGTQHFPGSAVQRSASTPLEYLLPYVPQTNRTTSRDHSHFPPLSSTTYVPRRRTSPFLSTAIEPSRLGLSEHTEDLEESPLIPLLIVMVREYHGKRRFLVAKLLASLNNLGFVRKTRVNTFGSLLIPMLVRSLDWHPYDNGTLDEDFTFRGVHYALTAPAILALLIKDDSELQRIVVEHKAIGRLLEILKSTFNRVQADYPSVWKPTKQGPAAGLSLKPDQALGIRGPSVEDREVMTVREGVLQALAAIAPFNDEHRREICDQGALAQIMKALEPFQGSTHDVVQQSKLQQYSGNSASTLLAACGAVRALTRSVTTLRTKLVDAEVAGAILKLMTNPDLEVRIAATKVISNLALDFSPMKESLGDAAVVKRLCEQAHSANARLRFESIWALKQLVFNAKYSLKKSVLDELGPSWIKRLIQTDPADIPPGEVIGLVDRDYPPRRKRPTVHDHSNDVIMSDDSDDDQFGHMDVSDGDEDYNKHTVEDDAAIQEQLLDLVRNLFCGEDSSTIIEHLLREMGQDDVFRILLDRLRSRTISGATRKDNHTTLAPFGITTKVLYIFIHIAAGSTRHRTVIASHEALMRQIIQFFSHPNSEVRTQCCWMVINLTYEDEPSERQACKHRAVLMQRLGLFPHLRKLELDPELDVRERAKTALNLMTQLVSP